jgi:hypothetical protein
MSERWRGFTGRTAVILAVTCEHMGVSPLQVMQKERGTRSVALARQITMALIREELGLSYPELGHLFDRDHTTTMYAVKRMLGGLTKKGKRECLEEDRQKLAQVRALLPETPQQQRSRFVRELGQQCEPANVAWCRAGSAVWGKVA